MTIERTIRYQFFCPVCRHLGLWRTYDADAYDDQDNHKCPGRTVDKPE